MSSRTRPRSVVHACAAFGAGMLIALGAPWLGILAWVPAGLVIALVLPVAGAGLAFGLLGAGFHGRRGWWLALTAIPWSATTIIFWTLGLASAGDWGFILTQSIAAGLVTAGCALFSWPAAARAVGAVLVLLVAAVAGVWHIPLSVTGSASGIDRSGEAPVFTTVVAGYTVDETRDSSGGSSVLYRAGSDAFLLSTEPIDLDPCGAELIAPEAAETEVACTASAERWYRTSVTLHEVAVVRDGWLVRASAAQSVPLGDLENAIALAIPSGAEWTSDQPR